jgi:hypothetical protein
MARRDGRLQGARCQVRAALLTLEPGIIVRGPANLGKVLSGSYRFYRIVPPSGRGFWGIVPPSGRGFSP